MSVMVDVVSWIEVALGHADEEVNVGTAVRVGAKH
jgi:hypothetical protein